MQCILDGPLFVEGNLYAQESASLISVLKLLNVKLKKDRQLVEGT